MDGSYNDGLFYFQDDLVPACDLENTFFNKTPSTMDSDMASNLGKTLFHVSPRKLVGPESPKFVLSDNENHFLEPVYCVCRGPENGMMIECSECRDWFHITCINMSKAQALTTDTYYCPRCVSSRHHSLPQNTSSKKKLFQQKPTSNNAAFSDNVTNLYTDRVVENARSADTAFADGSVASFMLQDHYRSVENSDASGLRQPSKIKTNLQVAASNETFQPPPVKAACSDVADTVGALRNNTIDRDTNILKNNLDRKRSLKNKERRGGASALFSVAAGTGKKLKLDRRQQNCASLLKSIQAGFDSDRMQSCQIDNDLSSTDTLFQLVRNIESALWNDVGPGNDAYNEQLSCILFNLSVSGNYTLRTRLVTGELSVTDFVRMSNDDMAPESLLEKRKVLEKLADADRVKDESMILKVAAFSSNDEPSSSVLSNFFDFSNSSSALGSTSKPEDEEDDDGFEKIDAIGFEQRADIAAVVENPPSESLILAETSTSLLASPSDMGVMPLVNLPIECPVENQLLQPLSPIQNTLPSTEHDEEVQLKQLENDQESNNLIYQILSDNPFEARERENDALLQVAISDFGSHASDESTSDREEDDDESPNQDFTECLVNKPIADLHQPLPDKIKSTHPVVWCGTLIYRGVVPDFTVLLRRISGPRVENLFKDYNINSWEVSGRVNLDMILEYLRKIESSSSRTCTTFCFEPDSTNPISIENYQKLIDHFCSISRAGVVTSKNYSNIFVEIYICPVSNKSPSLPNFLPKTLLDQVRLWLLILTPKNLIQDIIEHNVSPDHLIAPETTVASHGHTQYYYHHQQQPFPMQHSNSYIQQPLLHTRNSNLNHADSFQKYAPPPTFPQRRGSQDYRQGMPVRNAGKSSFPDLNPLPKTSHGCYYHNNFPDPNYNIAGGSGVIDDNPAANLHLQGAPSRHTPYQHAAPSLHKPEIPFVPPPNPDMSSYYQGPHNHGHKLNQGVFISLQRHLDQLKVQCDNHRQNTSLFDYQHPGYIPPTHPLPPLPQQQHENTSKHSVVNNLAQKYNRGHRV